MNNKTKSIDSFSKGVRRKKMVRNSDGIRITNKKEFDKNNAKDNFLSTNEIRKYSVDGVVLTKKSKNFKKEFENERLSNKTEKEKVKNPFKMWKLSMGVAMIFGMITMSFIYKNFGQTAEASSDKKINTSKEIKQIETENLQKKNQEETNGEKSEEKEERKKIKETTYGKIPLPNDNKTKEQLAFEKQAKNMVKGYPIEKMLPYIFSEDREVASYLIAIAKQESNWGKRKPVLNGKDCYNYWGYRGKRKEMGSGGHTCFSSREDAVKTVGKRIHKLVYDYNKKNVSDMIVWKCGASCDGHSKEGVNRWINTVSAYKDNLLKK